ncbi:MAG TPA: PHP domain-containing protein, partial [Pseudidiomarina sp.]|nr:PHP domain-containing protein [Pseudidiomarina sp.]
MTDAPAPAESMPATPPFIHLRAHSDFSMIDGLPKVGPLCEAVAAKGMPAVALTDQMNMCGLVRFYRTAHKLGLKPIVGCDLWVVDADDLDEPATRLTALAMNNEGYQQLTQLISRGYLAGHRQGKPCINKQWLAEHNVGIILLSGGREGEIGRLLLQQRTDEARAALEFYQHYFADRFYLELVRTGRPREDDYLHAAVALAAANEIPVVATNEVVFLSPDNFYAHEIRVAVADGYTLDDKRRPKKYSDQQYLKSPQEMAELFADIPEALANTVEIAKRCNV